MELGYVLYVVQQPFMWALAVVTFAMFYFWLDFQDYYIERTHDNGVKKGVEMGLIAGEVNLDSQSYAD